LNELNFELEKFLVKKFVDQIRMKIRN